MKVNTMPCPFMRAISTSAIALAALASTSWNAHAITVQTPPLAANATVEVFFSPGANTDQAIAASILDAKTRVWIVGYYFTSATIAKALHEAHRRGIDVQIVLDRSQATARYSSATYFYNQGMPLRINARYPIMHHKFLVIDTDIVGLGSMNFTKAGAQKNAENFNIFRRWPKLAETYAKEFRRLATEAELYRPGMVFDQPIQQQESTE